MKTSFSLPVSVLPLFVSENGARTAQGILPYAEKGFVAINTAGEFPDDLLGGCTSAHLFELDVEMDAFAEGLCAANPGDDYTWQKYVLRSPVEGCKFVVIFHNCDAEPEISISKLATEA